MGQGIALACAIAGFKSFLYDIHKTQLEKAFEKIKSNLKKAVERGRLQQDHVPEVLACLVFTDQLEQVQADVIIEAAIEDLSLKIKLFTELEHRFPEAILATNTSSLRIGDIAASLAQPQRLVGMHFFNPAHLMKLVEVISTEHTDPSNSRVIVQLCEKLKKVSVQVKDTPGFIVNRVARLFYVESLKILEENVCEVGTIDALLESSGFRMGPFRLMDLIGVDTNLAVTTSMYQAFNQNPKFKPSRIQQQMVEVGDHGRKTGKGFYHYE